MAKILLAGGGWGAVAALKSLRLSKRHCLNLFTRDQLWKSEMIKAGIKCVDCLADGYDLIIAAGYKPLIQEQFLRANRVLNIHYSLLPAYRGLHSTVWAILNDEPFLGLTIHRMNQFVDDGPIVYQHRVANDFTRSAADYMIEFNSHVEEILLSVVDQYLDGKLPEKNQDFALASWVGRRGLAHCSIDFSKKISYQRSFFRALSPPYPFPHFKLNGEIFEVRDAAFHESTVVTDFGRILNVDPNGVWISCYQGYVICRAIFSVSAQQEIKPAYFKIGPVVDGFKSS